MRNNRLKRKILCGLFAAVIGSTSLSVSSEAAYAATTAQNTVSSQRERETDNNGKSTDALTFTERIQRILDAYHSDKSADVHFEHRENPNNVQNEHKENFHKVQEKNAEENTSLPTISNKAHINQAGKYNFDWQGTPIAQSLYAVAKIAHKDVVVNGDLKGTVYISLHNVTCDQAMNYLSKSFNFNWMVDGGAILISTDKLMQQSQTFKIHHAVDLSKVTAELTALGIEASNIYANDEARSVSVTGTPYQLQQAEKRLKAIDNPVSQCLVVAQLIEISHGKNLNLGMNYSLPTYSHAGGNNSTDSFRGNFLEKLTFSASSSASRELSKGKVISRPMIMMMNGQEGKVNFGEQVPVLSATSTSSSTDITVSYHDVGTKLNITPNIDEESGTIAMKIETEVSNISQWRTSGLTQAPQISTRQATTSAHLHSGQSFVIGGLMSVSELDNLNGIPGLMDLPILGKLFSYHSHSKSYGEVYIMITPYIVSDEIDPKALLKQAGE